MTRDEWLGLPMQVREQRVREVLGSWTKAERAAMLRETLEQVAAASEFSDVERASIRCDLLRWISRG